MSRLTQHIQELSSRGAKSAIIYQTLFRTFRWSYAELHGDVQRTATLLERLGIGKGDAVVLWAPNSPQWAMLFLATLYRGGVAVPADVGATPKFVDKVARETEAKVVFRSRGREQPEVDVPVRLAEELLDDIEGLAPQAAPAEVEEDDLAQVLYTSGTTGAPKGVMLTHRNVAANLESMERAIAITSDHLLVSVLPLSHVFEQSVGFWAALTHGATIVYLQVVKPSELLRALRRYPVSVLVLVPQVLGLLHDRIQQGAGRGPLGLALAALLGVGERLPWGARRALLAPVHRRLGLGRAFRFFVVGGAPLPPEAERSWQRLGLLVLQGYGLTEAAPVVTVNTPEARKLGSVGRALPGVELRIAPDGEVLVRGENVTPGYYRDPERTREALRDGWLYTGDVGELDAEGFLFLKGRKKDVIVTPAGLNVYAEDVEEAFRRVPGVRDAAVLEFQGRVHAVLLLEPGVDADTVVAQGNAGLAEYQRVRAFTVWPGEDFPRTTTRKAKKHEILQALERMQEGQGPPLPETEGREAPELVRVLGQVSGKPVSAITPEARLGPDLGLDSVARIALVGLLEERLHAEVPEEALTEETRVRELEGLVGTGAGEQRRFARWALAPPVRLARHALQRALVLPAYDWLVRQRVEGLEHLEGLMGPVVFAPNHASHLDTLAMYRALPSRFRGRLAVAQLAEFFEAPRHRPDLRLWKGVLFLAFTVLFNVYPLPRTRGFRQSLRYTGELLDMGWNVLVFPEGRLNPTGDIGPFREGTGVLAVEMRVPVVPVRIQGLYEVLPAGRTWPQRRGQAVVRFGQPLRARKESYVDFTARLEAAVRALGASAAPRSQRPA